MLDKSKTPKMVVIAYNTPKYWPFDNISRAHTVLVEQTTLFRAV